MALPLINGKSYNFAEINILIGGVVVVGVSEVNYTETQEKANNYGTGDRPVSRGRGPIEVTASIGLHMEDVQKLRQAAPSGSLLNLDLFDVQVTFLSGTPGINLPATHILKNCEFTDDGVETAQGDGAIMRTFALQPSHIVYK